MAAKSLGAFRERLQSMHSTPIVLDIGYFILNLLKGRAFAWQEAIIAVSTMFQRFNFRPNDPNYSLVVNENLITKPVNFLFHAIPRPGISSLIATQASNRMVYSNAKEHASSTVQLEEPENGLRILYGSNTGSALTFAERITAAAASKGTNQL